MGDSSNAMRSRGGSRGGGRGRGRGGGGGSDGRGNNNNSKENLVREIVKASQAIRQKHLDLKVGRLNEETILESNLRPIVEPLKQLVENTQYRMEPPKQYDENTQYQMMMQQNSENNLSTNTPPPPQMPTVSPITPLRQPLPETPLLSAPHRRISHRGLKRHRLDISTPMQSTPYRQHLAHEKRMRILPLRAATEQNLNVEGNIHETLNTTPLNISTAEELESSMRDILDNPERNLESYTFLNQNLGEISMDYLRQFVQDNKKTIDHVYGVYFTNNQLMIGNSTFDMDNANNIIINGTRYRGTQGLYELIFKRLPDDAIYTEADLRAYKSILTSTNAHKRSFKADKPIMGNKGYKYKHIIAPLFPSIILQPRRGQGFIPALKPLQESDPIVSSADTPSNLNEAELGTTVMQRGHNLPNNMTVANDSVDYVYWDNPNEIVDRLRLLTSSKDAGHTGHDNEIMSILEELREAGLIIN